MEGSDRPFGWKGQRDIDNSQDTTTKRSGAQGKVEALEYEAKKFKPTVQKLNIEAQTAAFMAHCAAWHLSVTRDQARALMTTVVD